MEKLIQKGNEEVLLDKMNYLLDHYQDYDKNMLHNYAVSNFSYEKVGQRFYKTYESILND